MHTPRLNVQDHRRTLVPNCGTSLFPGHAYKGEIPQTHTELICWCRKCCPVVISDSSHFRHDSSHWSWTWWALCKALWNFLRWTNFTQNITGMWSAWPCSETSYFSVSMTGRYFIATVWNSWQAWNKMATAMLGVGQTSTRFPLMPMLIIWAGSQVKTDYMIWYGCGSHNSTAKHRS